MYRLFKNFIRPFSADTPLLNCIIKLPQVIMGGILAFHFGKFAFGVPWSPERLNLSFFEVAPWFIEVVTNFNEPFGSNAYSFALLCGLTKIIGGILMILGLLTRLASVFVIFIMTIFLMNQDYIDFNFTYPLFFIAVSFFSLYFGSGKYGLDYLLGKKIPEHSEELRA